MKILRKLAGMSQRQLATKAGVSPALVNQIETGHRSLTKPVAVKLARALNTTPEAVELTVAAKNAAILEEVIAEVWSITSTQQLAELIMADAPGLPHGGRRIVSLARHAANASVDDPALADAAQAFLDRLDEAEVIVTEESATKATHTDLAGNKYRRDATGKSRPVDPDAGTSVPRAAEGDEYTDAHGIRFRRDSIGRARQVS